MIEEIETLGRWARRLWTSPCANVVEHLLKMEHGPREGLVHWRRDIVRWRRKMARALRESPGMKGELPELLDEAWEDGRYMAIGNLVEHAGDLSWADRKALERSWRRRLPEECPYALEDIAGYDPRDRSADPDDDIWPAAVACRMNEELGWGYPVRHRAPSRASGRGR